MHEIRSAMSGARVLSISVDEGQLIAEEDEVCVLESDQLQVSVVTDVPGVVREIHVDVGQPLATGDLIALIDES